MGTGGSEKLSNFTRGHVARHVRVRTGIHEFDYKAFIHLSQAAFPNINNFAYFYLCC